MNKQEKTNKNQFSYNRFMKLFILKTKNNLESQSDRWFNDSNQHYYYWKKRK